MDEKESLLPVNEIFYSLQGEAYWSGTPAAFVRMQGCDVGCSFCDTKATWTLDPQRVILADRMLAKDADDATYAYMSTDDIAREIRSRWPTARHVVLTGGEPATRDLRPLCSTLEREGLSVQLETSGTSMIRASLATWVTVSPKINMPGGLAVLPEAIARANEIKYPVATQRHLEDLQNLLACGWHAREIYIWLQPISQHPLATQRCIDWCKEHGYRLSLQTHKYLTIR